MKIIAIIILLQILSAFVFLEIIELNFCGFNKNIKKNIVLRSLIELNDIGNKNDKIFKSSFGNNIS